ncbi:MAG TPA: hypothetical protein VFS11_00580 [Gemmatimonadales bacterium]|nr:hypothetical protein [Gemmatimonadales bacterium]
MSQTPLATYLEDHLAGSVTAVELLEHLAEEYKGTDLGILFHELHHEIAGDQRVLRHLLESVGGQPSTLKQAAAWVAERAARTKLRFAGAARRELALFEALETLAIGVLGKRALWRALAVVAPGNELLSEHDYDALSQRAEDQYGRLEARRITVARTALLDE